MSSKFYYYNLVNRPQTVLTPSNESALFPANNIKDDRRTKVYRYDSSSESVIFDFISVEEVDTILLVPHIKNGWGFSSVTVEANATSDFTSPAFSTTITTEIDQEHEIAVKEIAPQSYRFWRLTFNGTTFIEVSKVFIGKALTIGNGRSIDFNWTYGNNALHNIQTNRYGQRFSDINLVQKRFSYSFSLLSKTEMESFYDLIDECQNIKPFWVRIGCLAMSDEPNRYSCYAYLDQIPDVVNTSFGRYSVSCQISEGT